MKFHTELLNDAEFLIHRDREKPREAKKSTERRRGSVSGKFVGGYVMISLTSALHYATSWVPSQNLHTESLGLKVGNSLPASTHTQK